MKPDQKFDKEVADLIEKRDLKAQIELEFWNLVWVANGLFQTHAEFEHQGNVNVLMGAVSLECTAFPAFSIDLDLQEKAIRAFGYTFCYDGGEADKKPVGLAKKYDPKGLWEFKTRLEALRWIMEREKKCL